MNKIILWLCLSLIGSTVFAGTTPFIGDVTIDNGNLEVDTIVERTPGAGVSVDGIQIDSLQIDLDVPSDAELETGTSTVERVFTTAKIKHAIDYHAPAAQDDEIVYLADCSSITNGLCIDTGDLKLYYWDSTQVVEVGTGAGGTGDITEVLAGTYMSGGGQSGSVTLNFDPTTIYDVVWGVNTEAPIWVWDTGTGTDPTMAVTDDDFTFSKVVKGSSFESTGGGTGGHYSDFTNSTAPSADPDVGRGCYFNGLNRVADGTDWDSRWLIENLSFTGNTETGIAVTSQTDGTVDFVIDSDIIANTIVFTGLDVTETSTGKKIRVPGAAIWVSAFSWCDQAANTLIYQIERATSLGGSFSSLGYLQHDSGAVSDTDTDIAGFTDPNAGDWIRVNITTIDADVIGTCSLALTLTTNTSN